MVVCRVKHKTMGYRRYHITDAMSEVLNYKEVNYKEHEDIDTIEDLFNFPLPFKFVGDPFFSHKFYYVNKIFIETESDMVLFLTEEKNDGMSYLLILDILLNYWNGYNVFCRLDVDYNYCNVMDALFYFTFDEINFAEKTYNLWIKGRIII